MGSCDGACKPHIASQRNTGGTRARVSWLPNQEAEASHRRIKRETSGQCAENLGAQKRSVVEKKLWDYEGLQCILASHCDTGGQAYLGDRNEG